MQGGPGGRAGPGSARTMLSWQGGRVLLCDERKWGDSVPFFAARKVGTAGTQQVPNITLLFLPSQTLLQ